MELIIAVAILIVTPIAFCKAVDEIPVTQVYGALSPKYWGTGDRYLVGDFMTEYDLEEMRKKVNSKDSKF